MLEPLFLAFYIAEKSKSNSALKSFTNCGSGLGLGLGLVE